MGTLVPIDQSKVPSKLLDRKSSTSASNFTDGVADSFPRLSIRGKAFWVRVNGKEYRAGTVDPNKGSIVDVVLVNASRYLAKTYYAKPFSSGDAEMPDCWSLDSIRPDASIARPVNPTCQDCPKNAFNSAPSGRGGKACQDSKRVVVTTADQLAHPEPLLLLMRLPQQSLKNLKGHVERLAGHGYVEPYACVTRMSFDMDVEFPKVQFDFVEPLTDQEFEAAEWLANSKKVNDMLKNPDFDNAASDANAKHANDEVTKLQHQRRLPQQGFVTAQEETKKTMEQQGVNVSRETSEDQWEDLGDGTRLNLSTGEIVDIPKAEPVLEEDPNVIKTSDGRFFNRETKKFVDSPYKGATAAPVSTPAKEETPKRTRRVKAKDVAEKAAETAPEPAKTEPEQEHSTGNGQEMPKPKVVAASPKLEALLGSLVPDEDQK